MAGISHNDYVLPSIQRQFVWKHGQIEELFDSLLRGYPFGTFMFWKLEAETQNQGMIKLYQFNRDIDEGKNTDNVEFNALASNNAVFAVIDGQQRLTALNIGLYGSYAYRKKGYWKTGNYPKRFLFLDIARTIPDSDNDPKKYNFKFLTDKEAMDHGDHIWYKVGDILKLRKWEDVDNYIDNNQLSQTSRNIIRELYRCINEYKTISYYLVEDQEADSVLDIFIRANSGGTPLSKSDLLMAMATHLWTKVNIRQEMVEIIDSVSDYGRDEKFSITRDFVLKTCLVLHSEDVKFLLVNFNPENIKKFEDNWARTRESIIAAFKYLDTLGFDEKTLQAKGPVIAIIYYIYSNNLENVINKSTFDQAGVNRKNITSWLIRSFINGLYGGAPDSTHTKVRKVLRNNPGSLFPYDALMEEYKDEGNGLYVSEDVLKSRLYSKFGSEKAGYILILLYSDLISKKQVHADHLHPKSLFRTGAYKQTVPEADWELVERTWNTVLNLQLLDSTLNESKNDAPLSEWIRDSKIDKSTLFLLPETSTELKDYRSFIETREKLLLSKLKSIMGISDEAQPAINEYKDG